MNKLPLKIAIFQYACLINRTFTAQDVMLDLAKDYRGEAQFTIERVKDYLQSFLGVNFLKEQKVEIDAKGELVIHCRITDYGLTRVKYIPPNSQMVSAA